ncbi:hypothetical protein MMC13_007608 [Lambiella insularis]|nr:hypothetical protein [Lambiella insularis]
MVVKRKREAYATPTSNDQDAASSTPEVPPEAIPVTMSPFTVEYTKLGDTNPQKRRTSVKRVVADKDHTPPKEEQGFEGTDSPVAYMVRPGSLWDSMKKYKNFIVSEKQFGVNDFVYINNGQVAYGEETEDDKQFWIARVLEVRASSPSAVYLRVYWMYWPSELPCGHEYYHGRYELVASNHMEIIDAMTVSGKAEVAHIVEDEDAVTVTGLYWRQKFDYRSGKVSALKRDCVCKAYHNPDKLLVHCVSSACGKWMHEDCLLKDALDKSWARLNGTTYSQTPCGTIQVSGDGKGQETTEVTSKVTGSAARLEQGSGRRGGSSQNKIKRKSRGKKVGVEEPEWNGKLEAALELKPVEDDEEGSTEVTGNVIITDLREKDAQPWKESLSCLFCHHALQ